MRLRPLLLLLLPCFAQAQSWPSYPEVVKQFYQRYSFESDDPVLGVNFTKKRKGWYVRVIDRVQESSKSEQLFWSAAEKKFRPILGFTGARPADPEQATAAFIKEETYSFYGYERCRYYGYNGWDRDLIRDLGNRDPNTFSDKDLESLGRAHSAYSSRFLWYQYGGHALTQDTLTRELIFPERPSARRIDSVFAYVGKGLRYFRLLAERNPGYPTMVGNAWMKVFNEQMYLYNQLSLAGLDAQAHAWINTIDGDESVVRLARTYLDACGPNAILFTYGDNDTYPLWYLQEKLGYRKDVAVLNTSLLGTSYYVAQLRRDKTLSFTLPESLYTGMNTPYVQQVAIEGKPDTISVSSFVEGIVNKIFGEGEGYQGPVRLYTASTLRMTVDTTRLSKPGFGIKLTGTIYFPLRRYVALDQLMQFDIIEQNLYTRPIYFAGRDDSFGPELMREGLLYRFLPLDTLAQDQYSEVSRQKINKFLQQLQPDLFHPAKGQSAPDSSFYDNVNEIVVSLGNAELSAGREKEAKALAQRLLSWYNGKPPCTPYGGNLGLFLWKTGYLEEGKVLLDAYADLLHSNYQKPYYRLGYMTRTEVLSNLDFVLYYLTPSEQAQFPRLTALREKLARAE